MVLKDLYADIVQFIMFNWHPDPQSKW